MAIAIGAWSGKSESKPSPIKNGIAAREALFLVGLGVLSVCLHAATRRLMDIPGHQGLGWIGSLMLGRRVSNYRWAAATSSVGAAGFSYLPFFTFNDPFRWLTFLLAGATIDLFYSGFKYVRHNRLLLAMCGGWAHATKPLTRVGIAQLKGWPYGSLRWGVAYPTATHFMFGFLGVMIAEVVVFLGRRVIKPKTLVDSN